MRSVKSLVWLGTGGVGVDNNPILICFKVKASSADSFDLMMRVTSLAITLINQISISTLATLKQVWNNDSATGTDPRC
ncbi:MAG: hypothetical protein ACLTZT_16105 [Butyricimonas faecalis]